MGQGHGWEGAVLKLLRGKDFTFTVIGAEDVTPHYRRLRLTAGGMLAATGVHPTLWVRLWFDDAGKPHQRAYTLVDPDPAAGTFGLEFALHEGRASDWARAARPGDTIEATVHGTAFTDPDPAPSHVFAVADPASLPALNSLLDAMGQAPATIWFETDHGVDGLPFRTASARHTVRPVPRRDRGAHLVAEVKADLPGLLEGESDPYVWIACDTATTRSLTTYVRKELALPKQRVNAMGYWRTT
ncbi:siderophore-interacting protein [Streptomyces sp. NBC_01571]|uniref:siderophore-interacting protein n=1 Tax=Streptomyces sp. NBC_01571 TaxID=2975883 RepID=UPI0022535ED2|nr:siderophore-interacting protein [Streptomyces sp. NBC_01571]MCX4576065.1 siderophore-interacting protein [Streptomyces sp. NBC_01571]